MNKCLNCGTRKLDECSVSLCHRCGFGWWLDFKAGVIWYEYRNDKRPRIAPMGCLLVVSDKRINRIL